MGAGMDNQIVTFIRQWVLSLRRDSDRDYGLSVIEFWLLYDGGVEELSTHPLPSTENVYIGTMSEK